jgi:hypothetical protein
VEGTSGQREGKGSQEGKGEKMRKGRVAGKLGREAGFCRRATGKERKKERKRKKRKRKKKTKYCKSLILLQLTCRR